jgi:hypothetical protein
MKMLVRAAGIGEFLALGFGDSLFGGLEMAMTSWGGGLGGGLWEWRRGGAGNWGLRAPCSA